MAPRFTSTRSAKADERKHHTLTSRREEADTPSHLSGKADLRSKSSGHKKRKRTGNSDSQGQPTQERYRPGVLEKPEDLLREEIDCFVCNEDVDAARKELRIPKTNKQIRGVSIPLLDHQILGVHWMLQREKSDRLKGGILGDDMGLGKTVQALAIIAQNRSRDANCKATLILPTIMYLTYYGPHRSAICDEASLKRTDVVLTTYETLIDDAGLRKRRSLRPVQKRDFLFKTYWYRVILDEASAVIRNKDTKAFEGVKKLQAEIKWCLSGTLIYNKLADVYPLLAFVGRTTERDFFRLLLATKGKPAAACEAIRGSMLNGAPIIDLQPKEESIITLDFSQEERRIYENIRQGLGIKANKFYELGSRVKETSHFVFALIQLFRQLCSHPALLRAPGKHGVLVEEIDDEEEEEEDGNQEEFLPASTVEEANARDVAQQMNAILSQIYEEQARGQDLTSSTFSQRFRSTVGSQKRPSAAPRPGTAEKPRLDIDKGANTDEVPPSNSLSTKLIWIKKYFSQPSNLEGKTLIFSSFTKMLELVGALLTEEGIPHVYFYGKMSYEEREAAVQSFAPDHGPLIMLASISCGATGLNLTAANTVIMLDLPWSPAVEAQAWARVHRIGQTKPVRVFRVIIKDTIEEGILEKQNAKRLLADGTVGEKDGIKIKQLSLDEVLELLR